MCHLKERECGQMGVTMTAGTEGWTILAPAAAAGLISDTDFIVN